jgi:hypothetical protein
LKKWYISGEGAQRIRWGTPGAFERCVRLAERHMDPAKAKGFCANVAKAATGQWPGAGRGKDVGVQTLESTRYPYLPGSYEECRDTLREMAAKFLGVPIGRTEVVATWPDRVVVTTVAADGAEAKSFELPYSATAGKVMVGQPVAVQLSVSVAGDGDAPVPYATLIEEATDGIKALLLHGEAKAGRVLSTANAKRLVNAVEQIVVVLKAAGLPVNDDPHIEEVEPVPETPDSTAPSARNVKTVVNVEGAGVTVVDADLVERAKRILVAAREQV